MHIHIYLEFPSIMTMVEVATHVVYDEYACVMYGFYTMCGALICMAAIDVVATLSYTQ